MDPSASNSSSSGTRATTSLERLFNGTVPRDAVACILEGLMGADVVALRLCCKCLYTSESLIDILTDSRWALSVWPRCQYEKTHDDGYDEGEERPLLLPHESELYVVYRGKRLLYDPLLTVAEQFGTRTCGLSRREGRKVRACEVHPSDSEPLLLCNSFGHGSGHDLHPDLDWQSIFAHLRLYLDMAVRHDGAFCKGCQTLNSAELRAELDAAAAGLPSPWPATVAAIRNAQHRNNIVDDDDDDDDDGDEEADADDENDDDDDDENDGDHPLPRPVLPDHPDFYCACRGCVKAEIERIDLVLGRWHRIKLGCCVAEKETLFLCRRCSEPLEPMGASFDEVHRAWCSICGRDRRTADLLDLERPTSRSSFIANSVIGLETVLYFLSFWRQ